MIEPLALAVIVLAGVYLVVLGASALLVPAIATRFLLGFAGSARTHYAELLVRFVIGAAFVIRAPSLSFALVFEVAGWVLIVTTAGLLVVPWRWHQRFAGQAVPRAVRHMALIGACSLLFGAVVLFSAFRGVAA